MIMGKFREYSFTEMIVGRIRASPQRATPGATTPFRHHGIMAHAMTIRLDDDLAGDLATVAAVDGKPVSEVVRQAVTDYVTARKADPAFRTALRRHIGKAQRLLEGDAA